MSKISTYEVTPVPKLADKLIGTSVGGDIEDITYNFTLSELLNLFIPNIPANTLQGVLDYGNEATQDIILNGTIFTTYIEVTDSATILNSYLTGEVHLSGGLYDSLDSVGTAGQVLRSTGDGVEWYTVPTVIPTLQQVLASGNTADINIILSSNIQALTATANNVVSNISLSVNGTLKDKDASVGTAGQILSSTGTKVQWIDLPIYSATSPLHIDTITKTISIQKAGSTQDGYLSSADWITFSGKQDAISLTTIGSNGPSTLVGTTINVPNYTLSGLGGVPQTRTLTINGVTYNLSADRTWTIAAGVSSVTATSPLFSTGGVNPDISIQKSDSSLDGYLSNTDWLTFNSKQPAGNYITSLIGEATGSGPGATAVTLSNSAVIGKLLTGLNITGGTVVATDSILTAFGKVQNQINSLVGGVIYKGVWNASTNTPTLTSSVGTQGNYYIVNVAGNTNLNGITDWNVGDWAIFNGSAWNKVDNTDAVTSVNGQTGAVSLTTDNIPEGTTNLYYLDSRARAALSFAAGSGAYNNTTGVITIPTNTNQLTNGAAFITLGSLSASSPLSYNNLTGAFAIQVANTTQNGYLSSTDWNIFNSKQAFLNGTGLVKSVAGTISYITDNSTNWNTAYDNMIVSAAVTGTSTKTLTLNQQNAGTITASWTDLGLTSVGVSMPSAFSVSGSPLTSNGTIAITGAGTTLQYIDGTGALQSFPSLTGYVPYTGAIANVNLGTFTLLAGKTLIGASANFTRFPNALGVISNIPSGIQQNESLYIGFIAEALSVGDTWGSGLYGAGYTNTLGTGRGTGVTGEGHVSASTDTGVAVGVRGYANDVHSGNYNIGLYGDASGGTFATYGGNVALFLANGNIVTSASAPKFWYLGGNITFDGQGSSKVIGVTNGASFALGTVTSGIWNATAIADAYIASAAIWNAKQDAINLTTTGSNGSSTLIGATLNIPTYTLSGLGGVPSSRTLNINGTSYDLSADRSWSVGTVTSVAALTLGTTGTDLNSSVATGTTTPVITLNVPTASAANRGALSAADWATFNGKVGGVTASSPLSSSGGTTPNITIQVASGSQNGYLSSTDWTTFNNKQAAGNYITSLTGEATASGPGAASVTLSNSAVTGKVLTGINITGGTVVDTDSILTAFGKVQNQINGLVGGSIYKGTWNASTNVPALASGVGTRGWYYIVSVAGTTNLDGITDWFIGDWAIFDGTAWQQVDNTDAVVSVNGQTGAVSLTTDDIPEGATNQYFLNSRARAALSFTAGSGAYNSTTGIITIPTNTNQLTNGASFITLASLSGTAPIVYSNTTGAISITQSGTASNGYLSSTDWNTFNNKQNALTNPVTGTGTANYLPKFTGASTIGNSIAYDGGSSIGINTNAPYDNTQFKLDVNGGFIVKNTSGVAAQFVLIDANPASGGNAGFFIQSVGGTSTAAWGQIQTYYGTSIAAGALRLQPSGGQVLVGTTTPSAFKVDISGTLRATGQLTLGSTITNGTYTYTLPGATGTLALTSQLTGGTVTSVAALTIGTSGTDLSSTVANSTTTPVITLNVPTASATNRGALSSADWTTFNNKQSALTNPVTGTGTANYLPKFTDTSTIGDSVISQNGTAINVAGIATFTGTTVAANGSINIDSSDPALRFRITGGTANNRIFEWRAINNLIELRLWNDAQTSASTLLNVLSTGVTNFTNNIAISTTSPAWASFKAINIFDKSISASSSGGFVIARNWYYDGGEKYFADGSAQRLELVNNGYYFQTAATNSSGAGATLIWSSPMTLASTGNLLLGTVTDAGYKLDVTGTGRFTSNIEINSSAANIVALTMSANSTGGVRQRFLNQAASTLYNFQIGSNITTNNAFEIIPSTAADGTTFSTAVFKILNTGAATFSSSVAVGTTLSSWLAGYPVMQMPQLSLFSGAGGGGFLFGNAYLNTSGVFTYQNSGLGASAYNNQGGAHQWSVAASGTAGNPITFTQAMTLTSGGNLLIGTTSGISGGGALQVQGNVNINGVFQINGVTIGGGGGSGITGSGTTNYLTKWTGSTTLGNSAITDDGSTVRIATQLIQGSGAARSTSGTTVALNLSGAVYTANSDSGDGARFLSIVNEYTATNAFSALSFRVNPGSGGSSGNAMLDMKFVNNGSGVSTLYWSFLSAGSWYDRMYITSTGALTAGSFFESSDKRLKTIIKDDYKALGIESIKAKLYLKDGKEEVGYYAQDLEAILPSAVSVNDAGFLSLSYTQVHTAKIAIIEGEVDILKKEVAELKIKLQKYEA